MCSVSKMGNSSENYGELKIPKNKACEQPFKVSLSGAYEDRLYANVVCCGLADYVEGVQNLDLKFTTLLQTNTCHLGAQCVEL